VEGGDERAGQIFEVVRQMMSIISLLSWKSLSESRSLIRFDAS
jgi:hypothetical protein